MAQAKCFIADYNDGTRKYRLFKTFDTTQAAIEKAIGVLPRKDDSEMYNYKFELTDDNGDYVGDVFTLNKFLFI